MDIASMVLGKSPKAQIIGIGQDSADAAQIERRKAKSQTIHFYNCKKPSRQSSTGYQLFSLAIATFKQYLYPLVQPLPAELVSARYQNTQVGASTLCEAHQANGL